MRQRRTEKEWAEILQKKLSDTPLEVISIDGLLPDSLCTVHCKVCNATYTVRRDCLTHYRNCSVCNNKRVIQGINDLYTTDKWMIPYLANPDDAYKYTKASPKKIMLKCPECGNKKIGCLNNLYHRGYRCTYCGDGISYPNKYIRNLLMKMNLDYLEFEYSPDWIKPQRFDAYFVLNGEQYIVEMDGALHFKSSPFGEKETPKEVVLCADFEKQFKANMHGIEVIRINCEISDGQFIKKQILKSRLNDILDLSEFDFVQCDKNSFKSELLSSCKDWNAGMCLVDIAEKHKVCKDTIRKWLRKGTHAKICKYSEKEARIRGRIKANRTVAESEKHLQYLENERIRQKEKELKKLYSQIYVYQDDNLVMKCESMNDCVRKLSKMLGRKCNSTNIKKGIVKNSVRYGFTYKTYKMVHNIA